MIIHRMYKGDICFRRLLIIQVCLKRILDPLSLKNTKTLKMHSSPFPIGIRITVRFTNAAYEDVNNA